MTKPALEADTYRQSFSVPYEYPVHFTRDLFAPENPLLATVFGRNGETRRHRALIYVDRGRLQVEWENEEGELVTLELAPGDVIENQPGRQHRVTAIEDTRLIEVSTPELEDVVRIEDDYNR